MLEKIKKLHKHSVVEQLRDVRVIGLVVFGIIVLLVSWSSVGVIQTNYELQKQIASMQEQGEVTKIENENQKLRNEYFKTDQFLELQTRRQFGKAAPGETLVLVPKEVALSKITPPPAKTSQANTQKPDKPVYQKNFESWMSYFLHRQ